MTVVAHPLDAVAGSPQFTAQQIRQTGSVLHGSGAGTPLGARDGFRLGTGAVLSISGSTWRVAPCSGVLDTGLVANGDPYEWAVTVQESGAVAAADASNPRIDVVYLRVADNAVDSAGAAAAFVEYKAGVPASSPVAPTTMADGATPLTRGFVIGTIAVPAAGGGNPAASTTRQWVGAAGGAIVIATFAELAGLAAFAGLEAFCVQTGFRYRHDGTRWRAAPGQRVRSRVAGVGYTLPAGQTYQPLGAVPITVTDPFGAGVPFKLEVYFQFFADPPSGNDSAVNISLVKVAGSNVIVSQGYGFGRLGRIFACVNDEIDAPTGGSVTFRIDHSLSGASPQIVYADGTENFVRWTAVPL